jgi:hypothetical protein
MKPIRYSPRQAALMVTFAVHSNPALARRSATAIPRDARPSEGWQARLPVESTISKIAIYARVSTLKEHVIAAMSEFERSLIIERVNAGIASARRPGVKLWTCTLAAPNLPPLKEALSILRKFEEQLDRELTPRLEQWVPGRDPKPSPAPHASSPGAASKRRPPGRRAVLRSTFAYNSPPKSTFRSKNFAICEVYP